RAARGGEAVGGEDLPDVRGLERLVRLAVDARDRVSRHALRPREAVPVDHLVAGPAGFGNRRDVARGLPERTYWSAAAALPKTSCTLPATVSLSAGPLPLYGTCTILIFAASRKYSVARCTMLPLPDDAYESLSGCFAATATSSFSVFAGT